jgi:hypothetical protein
MPVPRPKNKIIHIFRLFSRPLDLFFMGIEPSRRTRHSRNLAHRYLSCVVQRQRAYKRLQSHVLSNVSNVEIFYTFPLELCGGDSHF